MSDTESFEYALWKAIDDCKIDENADTITGSYIKSLRNQDRVVAAHIREIRDTAQREYHRGYEAGRHSMDAEHRAVAMRLRGLRFDGGSHENLSSIAYAIYPCATGWTCESAAGLRDKLIELMGGMSDGTADDSRVDSDCGDSGRDFHVDGLSITDELWNERQKAIAELRYIRDCLKGDSTCNSLNIANAIGAKLDVGDRLHESICNRLIYLLGGIDVLREMDANGTCPNDVPTSSITDELRGWAKATYDNPFLLSPIPKKIAGIADRIDWQFDRICKQQEAVLQSTIERMADENLTAKDERDHWKREASELRAKVDAIRGVLHDEP